MEKNFWESEPDNKENWQCGNCSILVYSHQYTPEMITEYVGIKPTRSVIKGNIVSKAINLAAPQHCWIYEIKFDDLQDIDEKLQQIALMYINKIVKIDKSEFTEIYFKCFINSQLAQAGFNISHKTIELLSNTGKDFRISMLSWGGVESD